MNISLLEYLKCVDCHSEDFSVHSIQSNSEKQISTGYITCSHCQSSFPIIDGVLITFKRDVLPSFLLPKEIEIIQQYAVPISLQKSSTENVFVEGQVKTHNNWSFQWLEMDTDTYEQDWGKHFGDLEQFHYYDIPIAPEQYDNKVVCEASCGFGRVIQILHQRVLRYIAFDLSGAVYKAIRHFPESEKLDVIRADMLYPPFKQELFDILFSPRAIHHTGNMNLALERLIPLVKKDGILAYSVYSRENNVVMWGLIEPLKRTINRFLPRKILLALSSLLAFFTMGFIHLIYRPFDMLHLRVLPLHNFFMVWSTFSFTTIKMNIFDLLHAPYAEYIDDSQIKAWEKKYRLIPIRQQLLHDTVWGYSARKL